MLGGLLAVCSAACFAFNNASVRRAVLTGSIVQGMAITVPLGVPLFFVGALLTGNLAAVAGFSPTTLVALSAAGVLHFVWGRYFNYRATRAMGTNLVAPIQRLSLVFRFYFARLINPQHEVFGGRVIVATIASLVGAVALSISADVVQAALPLPESVIAILNWRWP